MIKKIFLDNIPFKDTYKPTIGSYQFILEYTPSYLNNYQLHLYVREVPTFCHSSDWKMLPLNWIYTASVKPVNSIISAILFIPSVTESMMNVKFQNVTLKAKIMDLDITANERRVPWSIFN